jgi:hypothetical protein
MSPSCIPNSAQEFDRKAAAGERREASRLARERRKAMREYLRSTVGVARADLKEDEVAPVRGAKRGVLRSTTALALDDPVASRPDGVAFRERIEIAAARVASLAAERRAKRESREAALRAEAEAEAERVRVAAVAARAAAREARRASQRGGTPPGTPLSVGSQLARASNR